MCAFQYFEHESLLLQISLIFFFSFCDFVIDDNTFSKVSLPSQESKSNVWASVIILYMLCYNACVVLFRGDLKGEAICISIQGRVKLRKPSNFLPCLSCFPERLHCCCYIYFHCSYLYSYYEFSQPCALNAQIQHFVLSFSISYWDLLKFHYFQYFVLSFSISYWDLIKFHYFADTTKKRG
jgi:hypothetical protein